MNGLKEIENDDKEACFNQESDEERSMEKTLL